MRGKDLRFPATRPLDGITPAYAGKSSIVSPSSAVDWDHPRLCGEKELPLITRPLRSGSPPPMRGKVKSWTAAERVIPDHPRLCGEKPVLVFCILQPSGSPPPMRGKAVNGIVKYNTLGITPAYAGKSDVVHSFRSIDRDHPRLCGEKCFRRLQS